MTRIYRSILVVGAIVAVSAAAACAPQTRFEWGDYESALYDYSKSPDARISYEKALTKAIASGGKSHKVAPGLNAELGYMKLEDGDFAQAKADFEREMELFPESRPFLQGVIERMQPPAPQKDQVS
jgi:hypothetical protein